MSVQFEKFKNFMKRFKKKEEEYPNTQDVLGAYPLRMQISAVPERRYLRTARLLAVICLLNLGAMLGMGGVFAYYAVRPDVVVMNSRFIHLYTMDPEFKVIQNSERNERGISGGALVLEKELRNYLTSRYSVNLDPLIQKKNWGMGSIVDLYSYGGEYRKFNEGESLVILGDAKRRNVNKEVHIYSFQESPSGMWTGTMEVFDMPPYDPYHPLCDCSDNSRECLECKGEHNLGRHRYQFFIRGGLNYAGGRANPLGIFVKEIFLIPKIIHKKNVFWDTPSILKPVL